MRKRLFSILMTVCVTVSFLPFTASAAHRFIDVSEESWYHAAVDYTSDNGLMSGMSETAFEPQTFTTRAMLVTILHRLENKPNAGLSSFQDVSREKWYASAIGWAEANHIVSGMTETVFAPDQSITREQFATILYRYLAYKGQDMNINGSLSMFTDAHTVSDWAVVPLEYANAKGLIKGVTNTTLDPNGKATRAQTAAILMRLCETILNEKEEKAVNMDILPETPEVKDVKRISGASKQTGEGFKEFASGVSDLVNKYEDKVDTSTLDKTARNAGLTSGRVIVHIENGKELPKLTGYHVEEIVSNASGLYAIQLLDAAEAVELSEYLEGLPDVIYAEVDCEVSINDEELLSESVEEKTIDNDFIEAEAGMANATETLQSEQSETEESTLIQPDEGKDTIADNPNEEENPIADNPNEVEEPEKEDIPVEEEMTATATNAALSWGVSATGAGAFARKIKANGIENEIVVAVVDSGIDATHPFLQGRLLPGYDYVENDAIPQDVGGHGTHVSGTIVDCTPGLNIKILPLRVLNDAGKGWASDIANATLAAVEQGAKVINLSLGGGGRNSYQEEVTKYAVSQNVAVIAAAGNENIRLVNYYPACFTECITVSAVNSMKAKAYFSNYGDPVDIAAPGVSIKSCIPGGSYRSSSGTSMAAPHVSAAAAMLFYWNPDLTVGEVEGILKNNAEDLGDPGWDQYFGEGFLNFMPNLDGIAIKKVSAANQEKSLKGAKFTLYDDITCTNAIDTVTTNADGYAYFNNVPMGTYYMKEIQAPVHYMLSEQIYQVNVWGAGNGSIYKAQIDSSGEIIIDTDFPIVMDENYAFHITNEQLPSATRRDIVLKKVAADNPAKTLCGALFALYEDASCTESIAEESSDANGYVRFMDLPEGTYYIKEIKAPFAYLLDETVYSFTIDEIGQVYAEQGLEQDYEGNFITKNTPILWDIPLKKVDAEDTEKGLEGAEFTLYADKDCAEAITNVITGSDGYASFVDMPIGVYYIKETNAPYGYVANEQIFQTTVKVDGSITITQDIKKDDTGAFIIPNHVITKDILLKKTSAENTQKALQGAEFGIYSDEACLNEISTGVTASDGYVRFVNFRKGVYYVKEINAPYGYVRNDEVYQVTIEVNGDIHTAQNLAVDENGALIITNRSDPSVTKRNIMLRKMAADNIEVGLEGAEFSIYDEIACIVEIDVAVSNADGYACFMDMPQGTYYIKEKTAPQGYMIDDKIYQVVIEGNGNVYMTQEVAKDDSGAFILINEPISYRITKDVVGNGTLEVSANTAIKGTSITMKAIPNDGYALSSILWIEEGGTKWTDITAEKSFVMPGNHVIVVATFEQASTFMVTTQVVGQGTIETSATSVRAGDTVDVTAVPAEDYEVDTITWAEEGSTVINDITNTKYFVMPAKNVVVTATFKELNGFLITATVMGEGNVNTSRRFAQMGSSITVMAEPEEGYKLNKLTYALTEMPNRQIDITQEKMFIMPAAPVTVVAEFVKLNYVISTEVQGDGTLTVSMETASKNDEITVAVEPAEGYEVDTITWAEEGSTVTNDITDTKRFIMPAKNVTVTATFKKINGFFITATVTGEGSVNTSHRFAQMGSSIAVMVEPEEGYKLYKLTYALTELPGRQIDITTGKIFIMPAADVTVHAIFEKTEDDWLDIDALVEDKTAGDAKITGRKNTDGTITIGVGCKDACVVAYTTDNGEIYHRIDAVPKDDGTYSFKIALPEGAKVIVAKKGDLDSNGKISNTESFQMKRFANKLCQFTAYQFLVADLNNDGKVTVSEAITVARVANGIVDQTGVVKIAW